MLNGSAASFSVTVTAVKFTSNDGGSFGVISGKFAGEAPAVSPVGTTRDFALRGNVGRGVSVDDVIEVTGTWTQHPRFGWQFDVTSAVKQLAHTEQALRAFLTRFSGVGPVIAAEIVRTFGGREGTLRVLEHEPARLAEVRGLGSETADKIGREYKAAHALRKVAMWLAGLDLGEKLTAAILDEWAENAQSVLTEDPYELMTLPRMGFLRADEVARTKFGVAYDDPRRAAAAVIFLLKENEVGFDGGHTWMYAHELVGQGLRPGVNVDVFGAGGTGGGPS